MTSCVSNLAQFILHNTLTTSVSESLQMHFKVAVRNFYVLMQAGDSLTDVSSYTHAVTGVGAWYETQNTIIIIHQPIQLQRASRDICLLANIY